MRLRRTAVMAAAAVAAIIIAVIAGMTFMGLFGREGPARDDPAACAKAYVQKAIERYERDGRQAAIEY